MGDDRISAQAAEGNSAAVVSGTDLVAPYLAFAACLRRRDVLRHAHPEGSVLK